MKHSVPMSVRCERCYLRREQCLCAHLNVLETATRVVVVAHAAEVRKTSNSGRLATLMLSNSRFVIHGDLMNPAQLDDIQNDGSTFLLFPSDSAIELSPSTMNELRTPLTLVVPDGNWAQARKMTQRLEPLRSLPRLKLNPFPPSNYRLRQAPHPGVVCTLEAISRALGILEGPALQSALEEILDRMQASLSAGRYRVMVKSKPAPLQ